MIYWIKLIFIIPIGIYLCSAFVAILYNRKLKKDGNDGIPYIDCFKIKKMLSVFLGFVIGQIPEHIIEQYVIRIYDDECRQCYLTESCIHSTCGCNAKYVVCSPLESCLKEGKPFMMGNFGEIIFNKKAYRELRKDVPVQIKVEYGEFNGGSQQDRNDGDTKEPGK